MQTHDLLRTFIQEDLIHRRCHDTYFRLWADGGIDAAANQAAGEGAIGVCFCDPSGQLIHTFSARVGWMADHHIAEYRALISGLRLALGHGVERLLAFMDSAVVVGQVNQGSRVKPAHLGYLREALQLREQFQDICVFRIPRKENSVAHKLADNALRAQKMSPDA